MNKTIKDLLISILAFFGILIVVGYIGYGVEGARNAVTDPINWAVVILVSIGAMIYRMNRKKPGTAGEEVSETEESQE